MNVLEGMEAERKRKDQKMIRGALRDIINSAWEGELFIVNLANQLGAGIIECQRLSPFIDFCKSTQRIERYYDVFSSSNLWDPYPENMYFVGADGGDKFDLDNLWLFRVIPLYAMNSLFASNNYMNFQTYTRNIRDAHERPGFDDSEIRNFFYSYSYRPQNFPYAKRLPSVIPLQIPSGMGVKLGHNPNGSPVFVVPLTDKSPLFGFLQSSQNKADALRDALGLDHLSVKHKGRRVALGFYCFRFRQIENGHIHRPTPFDNASPGRFRGCYGVHGGKVSAAGRTVHLGRVAKQVRPIRGVPELVVPNNVIKGEVYVGYLGVLENPRGKTYVVDTPPDQEDEYFLECCRGPVGRDGLISIIDNCAKQLHRPGALGGGPAQGGGP